MTEITQADRDAAGSLRPGVARFYARGQHDHCKDVKTFARHRMEATEALSAENERLREALRDVLVYAPDFMHGMPKKHYEKIANGSSDD